MPLAQLLRGHLRMRRLQLEDELSRSFPWLHREP